MPAKTKFYPKTYVHQVLEEMKNTDLEGGYTKQKCLDILADQVFRFFSSGKTVEEIMAIVNKHHSIITRADVTKIIGKYTEPNEKPKRKTRKKKDDIPPEAKNEGETTARVASYSSTNDDLLTEPIMPVTRNGEAQTAHSVFKPLPDSMSEFDADDPLRPKSDSPMARYIARHST